MNIATPVGSLLKSVDFGFIDDIEKLSVKQITNPEVFDSLGHPVTGGLYDLALGAFFKNICGTCGLDERFCTGHIGHIELPVPLYNPMFFPNMYLLLRSCCLYCHRLRLSASKSHFFECKLRLLQYGLLLEASILDENYGMTRSVSGDENDEAKAQSSEQLASRENYVTKCISDAIKDGRATAAGVRTPLVLQERKAVIKEFNRLILSRKKCENCGAYSPTYRKDGLSKIFEIPLSDKQENHNRAKGSLRRAMVFDAESGQSGSHLDTKQSGTRYVLSSEVCNTLRAVFRNEQSLFNVVFQIKPRCEQHVSGDMFFTHKILVPPTRYRLPSQLGDEVHANPTNEILVKCLQCCLRIRDLNNELRQLQLAKDSHEARRNVFTQLMNTFVNLQNEYNGFLDNTKNQNQSNKLNPLPGIKQHLEKKEGLFRKNMMGKRVNFAARSVISPDPNLETNEIGIPPVFALKLTYPEPVTTHNFNEMHRAVVNGPDLWPGATAVQNENGHLVSLIGMTQEQRTAIANQLMTPSTGTSATQISASAAGQTPAVNKKVLRHIRDQDVVLMNRQPTLHKASMMGHSVRVLPKEKTLRLHYANTGAYNADFDGDEMNMHFPQNESARTEALLLANTNSQYLTPTSGKPLRGLIQDHISAGVWLTNKDSFFTREQYHQLIFGSIRPETGQFASSKVLLIDPAVIKPVPLWTGKQIISTILLNIKAETMPGLNLQSKNKVKGEYWSSDSEENTVLFKNGDLLCGILDKSQYGAADYGLVHAVHEIYGPVKAGLLLSVLGRLFTKYIMDTAFTCGMDDLRLTSEGDKWRKELLQKANDVGRAAAVEVTNLDESGTGSEKELKKRLEEILRDDNKLGILDAITQSKANAVTSQVVSTCIPNGVEKAFPYNSMQTMALSGAKGSNVNVSQIMCGLGQQALEGRRVPVMVSGKTLPSFKPFETHVKAGGYIAGRFYSGIRPQEYYFHCMAGREGLIDTAVKTSRSGYLQRCLIKQLEGVSVRYDNTVRDADGTLVQFVYGGDSVDVVRESYLKQFDFCRENFDSLVAKHNPEWAGELNDTDALVYTKKTKKHLKKNPDSDKYDPVIMKYNPAKYIGAVSETFQRDLDNYIHETKTLKAEGLDKKFKSLMQLKYQQSLVDPGECVGIIASQSIGEPSTQMTLNTFHFAGHGAANVTLGIPRMREIIMTASPNIKTPQMILPINDAVTDAQADTFAKSITRIRLSQLVDKVIVTEKTGPNGFGDYVRSYSVKVQLFTKEEYENEYDITQRDVEQTLTNKFLEMLHTTIHKEFVRQKRQAAQAGASFVPVVKVAKKTPSSSKSESLIDAEASESDDDSDSDADMDDAKTNNRLEAENQENDDELVEDAEESDGQEDELEENDAAKEEEEEDKDVEMADDASSSEDELPRMALKGSARDREQAVFRMHPDVTRFNFDDEAGEWCEFTMEYDSATKKLLMVNLIEDVCRRCVVREIPGIDRCLRPANHKEGRVLVTEGVNFRAMWMDDLLLDPNGILSNDVAAVLRTYGVEAARATIAREISNVFETYAITVNHRHLELIADMMTREGTYLPFSRQGLDLAISPFLKMSFESTCQFMTRAVIEGYQDDIDTPSARVVVGRPMCAGTGAFDVFTQAPILAA